VLVPLDEDTVQKAKACQDMLMYEKADSGQPTSVDAANRNMPLPERLQVINETVQKRFFGALQGVAGVDQSGGDGKDAANQKQPMEQIKLNVEPMPAA
jgi:hypothetical protein